MKKLRGEIVYDGHQHNLKCDSAVYAVYYINSPQWCRINPRVTKLKWLNFAMLDKRQLATAVKVYADWGPNKMRVRHIGDK